MERDAWERRCYDDALSHGIVRKGMTVRVVRGRKVPLGKEGVVSSFYDWRDCYGRVRTRYVILDDGTRVNVNNVQPIA